MSGDCSFNNSGDCSFNNGKESKFFHLSFLPFVCNKVTPGDISLVVQSKPPFSFTPQEKFCIKPNIAS